MYNYPNLLASLAQGAEGKPSQNNSKPNVLAKFKKWHLFTKARSLNDGKPTQRHLRPYFTDHIFIAMSRCRKPTSARLFETSCRPKLWDSVLLK
jgi:hypothetical protein